MEIIKNIIKNNGSLIRADVAELAKHFPNLQVCVKMGASPRFVCGAVEVKKAIAELIAENPLDYVREVFIPFETYDALCAIFGVEGE